MVFPPVATLLIAAGLLLFSLLVVNRAKKTGLVNRWGEAALACLAALIFVAGLVLHIGTPSPARPAPAPVRAAPGIEKRMSFSFEPKSVRWGDEVRLQIIPETEEVTIYLNGKPLVHRAVGKGTFVVTVPSMSKSGRLAVECAGRRVESSEELTVLPR